MEVKALLNQEVKHKKFGLGNIVGVEGNHITVSFSIGEKKFAYPMALENFLCLEDSKLQESAILDLKAFKEVKEKKKEQMALESKRYITPQTYRRGMATEKIQAVSRQTILERGLQIGDVFNTICEIINTCFGTKYEGYQRAWFRVNEEYAAWFPKLAIYENGRPHAASDKGWVNVISDDGNTELVKGLSEDKPIFVGEEKIYNSTVNDVLMRHCKNCDISVISIHGLRHTHAFLLLFAGVSIASVARRLGHASMTTTQKTYLHIIQELENKDVDLVMRTLSGL